MLTQNCVMLRKWLFFRRISKVASDKMVRVLNVAEKNDAAKSISEVITRGRYRKREGFSKYNKIYEFDYNMLNQNCNMVMTSVSGHLLGMDFIGQYRKWYSCSPVSLFDVAVEKFCPENSQDIKRTLEREVRAAQFLVIWTDCDREGENIGFEVIQVCKAVKPNLQVFRARFSEITPQAIARACQNLAPPDKNVSDAVDVRSELDLRIGAAFTRFQTMRLQKIFPNVLAEQLISYGSCQFPTLGFVVERYKQVQAFIPEPFWKIKVSHKVEEVPVEFNWKRNRLFDYNACLILYEHCIENPMAKVTDVHSRSKSKWRPVALDTVELEKLASRKLKINSKETMRIAEKLYTQGFISYPRTETNQFAQDMDLSGMVEAQTRDPRWGDFARRVLERGPQPRNGKKTDQAHPPIHPTKYTDSLQGNEQRLYEFIVRHFLACCSEDAQGFETTVEINVADERFSAQGLMIIARNYLEIYIYEKWNAKEIPVFQQGDEFQPNAIELNAGETNPPLLLSEADLISLMDKHGIGTDATHADHIETIKSRKYVGVRPDGRFVPGQLGMGLVEGYDAMGYEMSKPHLRAELEADLKKICEGKKQKQAVLDNQVRKYKEVFIEACRQAQKIDESLAQYLGEEAQAVPETEGLDNMMSAAVPVMKCPQCGQEMLLKPKKDKKGYYIGCMGFPACRSAIWLPDSVLEAAVEETPCSTCGPDVHPIKFKFKRGSVPPGIPSEYTGCIGGCDSLLSEALDIRLPARRPSSTPNATQGNKRSQSSMRDSGIGSSLNTTGSSVPGSRGYSTQASQSTGRPTAVASMFSPTQTRITPPTASDSNTTTYNSFFGSQSGVNNSNTTTNNNRTNNSFQGNGNTRRPLAPVTGNARNSGNSDGPGGNEIVCNCGQDAVLLTVRKEGPNTGRQFYKCGGSSCNFFLWADEAGSGGDKPTNRNTSNGNQNRNYGNSSSTSWNQNSTSGDAVTCKCGQPAKSLTVQKEGPNQGRPFYGCPAPRGEGCNFFQWGDEDPGTSRFDSGGGGFGGGGAGRGRGQGGPGGSKKRPAATGSDGAPVKKSRKCGLCGVEGHTRKTCPHK